MLQSVKGPALKAVFLAYTSLLLLGMSDNIRGPLFPEILQEFGVNDTTGSLFFSLSSLCGFFGGLLSDRLIHRWGTVKALRIALGMMMVSQVSMAFSSQFIWLVLSVFVFGASMGIMGVIQNVLIVRDVPNESVKNRLLSGLHGMYAAASLLAPLLVNLIAFLLGSQTLWRICLLVTAGFSLAVLGSTFAGPKMEGAHSTGSPPPEGRGDTGAQIFFGMILAAYVLAEMLISSRMALYMRREFSSSLEESSWYTAGFFVCLLMGRVVFMFWTPRVGIKKQLALSLTLAFISTLIGLFVHPLALVLSGFFMGPYYPLMMVAAGKLFADCISRAISWAIAMANLFVVIMHFTVGYLTDLFGLQFAFLLGPFFCLLALGLLLSYEKVFRRLQHTF